MKYFNIFALGITAFAGIVSITYACIDQDCVTATLVNGRYERDLGDIRGLHSARFQIDGVQPNPTPEFTFTAGVDSSSPFSYTQTLQHTAST